MAIDYQTFVIIECSVPGYGAIISRRNNFVVFDQNRSYSCALTSRAIGTVSSVQQNIHPKPIVVSISSFFTRYFLEPLKANQEKQFFSWYFHALLIHFDRTETKAELQKELT